MAIKKFSKFSSLLILIFILSACSVNVKTEDKVSQPNSNLGGLFKSSDKGDTWVPSSNISDIGGQNKNFSSLSVNSIKFDPSDDDAIYYASLGNGLLYSYDNAKSWMVAKELGPVNVLDIAIDPKSKCTVYATIANKVMKTTDCMRTWKQIFFDTQTRVKVNSIAIDHFDTSKV